MASAALEGGTGLFVPSGEAPGRGGERQPNRGGGGGGGDGEEADSVAAEGPRATGAHPSLQLPSPSFACSLTTIRLHRKARRENWADSSALPFDAVWERANGKLDPGIPYIPMSAQMMPYARFPGSNAPQPTNVPLPCESRSDIWSWWPVALDSYDSPLLSF